MFSVREKRLIADNVQKILQATRHPELPPGEIRFVLEVAGKTKMSWARICNNGSVSCPSINPHNEAMDRGDRGVGN